MYFLNNDIPKFDRTFTQEEYELNEIKRNILNIKQLKLNRSDVKDYNCSFNRKPLFNVHNTSTNCPNPTSNILLNHSCGNLGSSCPSSNSKKKGRKKYLLDGVKTELVDKAFLREFRNYIAKHKVLRAIYDELKGEEKLFWNEFLQNTNAPFSYTINGQKTSFKSFNHKLLIFLFSQQSMRQLYDIFVKNNYKEIISSVQSKKIKKIDNKTLLFYSFYGKNLHKIYSNEYNACDLNMDELENTGLFANNSITNSLTHTSSPSSLTPSNPNNQHYTNNTSHKYSNSNLADCSIMFNTSI